MNVRVSLGAAILMFLAGTLPSNALEIIKPKAVVELFTSQGCSSCPPADAALKEFNSSDAILGLALHVDYWDRLGWPDTFGSAENTKRQWRYARSLGERQVYTPQAIVNGRTHLVGSRKAEIQETANRFSKDERGLSVPINITMNTDSISVSIPSTDVSRHATLYAFYFNPSEEVTIKRGENAGKTLRYTNIVRKVEMIGMVGAKDMAAAFSLADLEGKGFEGCALILQASTSGGNPGAILGASVLRGL
jgi:hypothetical protein